MLITPTITWNRFDGTPSVRFNAVTGVTTATSTVQGGVTVNMSVGGAVASLDGFRLIAVLVQAMVLIGLSNYLVSTFAW